MIFISRKIGKTKTMNKEEMYEEFGRKSDYSEKIHCENCKKILCFVNSNIDVIYDDVTILCKDCRKKLP